jgi:hypothetical protein
MPAIVNGRAGFILKIAVVILVAAASNIWIADVSATLAGRAGSPSIWVGVGALALLIGGFGIVYWWLYLSPIPVRVTPNNTPDARQMRRRVGLVMILGSLILGTAGAWDGLWHIWKGGFGDDFLWPPHMLLYGSFLIDAAVAGLVLGRVVIGRGDPRVRVRQEPALGIAALVSAYLLCSLPSDAVWHQIYGVDITPWSLPHVLIMVMSSVVAIAATSLLLTSQEPGKRSRVVYAGVVMLIACAIWTALLLVTSEYEWGNMPTGSSFWMRPGWVYPMAVMIVGLTGSLLVLHLTERPGSAMLAALLVLGGRLLFILAASTLPINRSMIIASHLFMLVPAIAVDAYYTWQLRQENPISARKRGLRAGMVYGVVYWPLAVVVTSLLKVGPIPTLQDFLVGLGIGLAILVLFAVDIPTLASGLRRAESA